MPIWQDKHQLHVSTSAYNGQLTSGYLLLELFLTIVRGLRSTDKGGNYSVIPIRLAFQKILTLRNP